MPTLFHPEHTTDLVAALAQVRARGIYPPPSDVSDDPDDLRDWLLSGSPAARWVATTDGTAVGHAMIERPHSYITDRLPSMGHDGSKVLEVCKVFVAPAHRHHGHGRALLSTAREFAHEQGCGLVLAVVDTSTWAIDMYHDQGMVVIGEFAGIHGRNLVMHTSTPGSARGTE